jgi:hypothetical protein
MRLVVSLSVVVKICFWCFVVGVIVGIPVGAQSFLANWATPSPDLS